MSSSWIGLRGVDDPVLGDLEHLRLGEIDRLDHVVGLAERDVGDLTGGVDEPAQQRRVHHDAGVVLGARHRRRGVLQLVQPLDAAELVEQAVTTKFVGDRDDVDGTRRRVDRTDGVEDVLMGGAVEVPDLQPGFADQADRVARQEQRTSTDSSACRLCGGMRPADRCGRAAVRSLRSIGKSAVPAMGSPLSQPGTVRR